MTEKLKCGRVPDGNKPYHIHNSLIDVLGGTSKVALICDSQLSAVSRWRRTGIPKPQLRYINVCCKKIYRDWELAAESIYRPLETFADLPAPGILSASSERAADALISHTKEIIK